VAVSSFDARYLRRATRRVLSILEDRIREISSSHWLCSFFRHVSRLPSSLVNDFLESDKLRIVGIDGSYAVEERMELLLLYVCAAGFSGWIYVDGDSFTIDVSGAEREDAFRASASVPLWMEDLPNVSPQSSSALTDYDVKKSIESVPYALMTMAELYLAYKALCDDRVGVVILDRLLSGTYGPASRDFRLMLRRGSSALTLIDTSYGRPSMLDLHLAGYLGTGVEYVPPRGIYGVYALIKLLIEHKLRGEAVRLSDIPKLLGVSVDDAKRFVRRALKLNDKYNGSLLDVRVGGKYLSVCDGVEDYWHRVWSAARSIIDRVLSGECEHPLMIGDTWITTLDLNSINVFLIHGLISRAISENKLVIGIAKDTTTTDLIRSVIPVFQALSSSVHGRLNVPALRSDRALLSMISAANFNSIKTPWRTVEYDSCFATMVGCVGGDSQLIACAARRAVFREQLFVRGYFQLRSLKSDPSIRSAVFAYDRPFYPRYDSKLVAEFDCLEWNRISRVKPMIEVDGRSGVGDMVISILSMCDNPYVVEEMGYNHLLFLADKYVKSVTRSARAMLRGIANLDLVAIANKYKAYFSSRRFRDIRSEVERARERVVREEYE